MTSLRKSYPFNYPEDVRKVVSAMCVPKGKLEVAGSVAMRTQNYWGDIDAKQDIVMSSAAASAKDLQDVAKRLRDLPNTYMLELKAGLIEEYRILPKESRWERGEARDYDYKEAHRVIDSIPYLDDETKKEYKRIAVAKPSAKQFFLMRDTFKEHVCRWSFRDVMNGYVSLPNHKKLMLEDAITQPSMVKMDAVSWIQGGRFVEVSMIYDFFYKGKRLNERLPLEQQLRENIAEFAAKGQWVKVMKRIFSLANIHGRDAIVVLMTPLLNGDIGKIYQVASDVSALLDMLERHIYNDDMRFEIDQFKGRLANVYNTNTYIASEGVINSLIDKAKNRKEMVESLTKLLARLEYIMNSEAHKMLVAAGLLPLASEVRV